MLLKNQAVVPDRRVRREVKRDSSLTSNPIKANIDAECSSRTIRRHLNKKGNMKQLLKRHHFAIKPLVYDLLPIIKPGMWINGRKCYFQTRKNSTFMAQAVFSVSDMQKLSQKKFFRYDTVEVDQLWSGVSFVQWNS